MWCLQGKKTVISINMMFDEASMLKAPLPANCGSPILVEKENKASDTVVEMKITTSVNTQVTDFMKESNEDGTTLGEGSEISAAESGQQQIIPSLASRREPRARRAPIRYGYKDMVSYALVGYGDELTSYQEAMDSSKNAKWKAAM